MPQFEYNSLNGYNVIIDQADSVLYDYSIKNLFIDCITYDVVKKPVFTKGGFVYELDALRKWFMTSSVDPSTGKEIDVKKVNAIPVINTFVALLLLEQTDKGILYHIPKMGIFSLFALGEFLFPLSSDELLYDNSCSLYEYGYNPANISNKTTKVAELKVFPLRNNKVYIGQKYYTLQIDNILDTNWENACARNVNLEGCGELTKANNFSHSDCYFGSVAKIELQDLFKCIYSKRSVYNNAIITDNGTIIHNKFNNINCCSFYLKSLMSVCNRNISSDRPNISTYIGSIAEYFNLGEETDFKVDTKNCDNFVKIPYDDVKTISTINLNHIYLNSYDKFKTQDLYKSFIIKNNAPYDMYVNINSVLDNIKKTYLTKVHTIQQTLGMDYLDTIKNRITISTFSPTYPAAQNNKSILHMKSFYKIPFIDNEPFDQIYGLDLSGLIIKNLVMTGEELKGYLFVGTIFINCIFIECKFMTSKFILSQFQSGTKFIECDFNYCGFLDTNVTNKNMQHIFINPNLDIESRKNLINNSNNTNIK